MVMNKINTKDGNRKSCTDDAVFLSARRRFVITLLFVVAASILSVVSFAGNATPDTDILHQYTLLPGLQCHIGADGTLIFSLDDSEKASSLVVLEGRVVSDHPSRRANPKTKRRPFHAVVRQGASGGRRGFSALADDDADGKTDEDFLDGRDNDGDGLVDEDYAAIADAMVVVDNHDGHQGSHLEFYHWSYPQLQSAVFIDVAVRNALDEPASGWWRLDLPETRWREAEINSLRHGPSGKPEVLATAAFVAEIPGVLDSGSLWLGTVVLDKSAQNQAGKLGQRVRLENGILDTPSGEGSLPVVVCAARSWLQLSRALSEALVVHKGTTDHVSGVHVPWIVSPGCMACRKATPPEAEWELVGDKGIRLSFQIKEGMNGCFDPDLFSIYGIHLGSPGSIMWNTNELPFASRVWNLATLTRVARDPSTFNNPYSSFAGFASHTGAGVLGFEFAEIPPELLSLILDMEDSNGQTLSLQVAYMDGRLLTMELDSKTENILVETPVLEDREEQGATTDLVSLDQLTLSTELLAGYPNPFKDSITIRFGIPQTMESAFSVPDDEKWPSEWDKSAAVPWESGSPTVSVKIYNINGQELRTLHEGNHVSGEFTVAWDGSDAFGRQVASGTYFCKLQLDKWSVTRRVIFLR
jgi:hypothetical protein